MDMHHWFSSDELEPCPECGEGAGITLPESGSFLCLGCGHVHALNPEEGPAKEPDVT